MCRGVGDMYGYVSSQAPGGYLVYQSEVTSSGYLDGLGLDPIPLDCKHENFQRFKGVTWWTPICTWRKRYQDGRKEVLRFMVFQHFSTTKSKEKFIYDVIYKTFFTPGVKEKATFNLGFSPMEHVVSSIYQPIFGYAYRDSCGPLHVSGPVTAELPCFPIRCDVHRTMITFARKGRWEGDAGMKQLLSEARRSGRFIPMVVFRTFFVGKRLEKESSSRGVTYSWYYKCLLTLRGYTPWTKQLAPEHWRLEMIRLPLRVCFQKSPAPETSVRHGVGGARQWRCTSIWTTTNDPSIGLEISADLKWMDSGGKLWL